MYRTLLILLVTLAWGWAAQPCCAQDFDQEKLVRLKAAFIYNLMKFTKWPDTAFTDEQAPIVVGAIGESPVIEVFEAAVAKRTVGGRAIAVRHVIYPSSPAATAPDRQQRMLEYQQATAQIGRKLADCHVVYVSPSARPQWDEMRKAMRGRGVLTISDSPAFADEFGMVEITLNEDGTRLAMRINMVAVEQTELRISSQVMNLATVVRSDDPDRPASPDVEPKGDRS